MANRKYNQVADLLLEGQFHWPTDQIVGLLMRDAVFHEDDAVVSQTNGEQMSRAVMTGCALLPGGAAIGYPLFFQQVSKDIPHQLLIAKDIGNGDPLLLAFIDEDDNENPLTLTYDGTFIVRPTEEIPVAPDGSQPPPTIGIWLRFTIPLEVP